MVRHNLNKGFVTRNEYETAKADAMANIMQAELAFDYDTNDYDILDIANEMLAVENDYNELLATNDYDILDTNEQSLNNLQW